MWNRVGGSRFGDNWTSQSPKLSKLSTCQGTDKVGIAMTGYTTSLQGRGWVSNRISMLETRLNLGKYEKYGLVDVGVLVTMLPRPF